MCLYPNIITNLYFVSIDFLLLDLCKGESMPTNTTVEDGTYVTSVSN